jgi:hypothetical protein
MREVPNLAASERQSVVSPRMKSMPKHIKDTSFSEINKIGRSLCEYFSVGALFFSILAVAFFILDVFVGFFTTLLGARGLLPFIKVALWILIGPFAEEMVRIKAIRTAKARAAPSTESALLAIALGLGWGLSEAVIKVALGMYDVSHATFFSLPFLGFTQVPLMHIFCSLLMWRCLRRSARPLIILVICAPLHAAFNLLGLLEIRGLIDSDIQDWMTVIMLISGFVLFRFELTFTHRP